MSTSKPSSGSISTEIIPHSGISGLPFGSSRAEIQARLGEPTEIDRYTDSEEFTSESWHYDDIDLSLVIEEDEDWRLTTFAVSGEQFVLNDQKIIGSSREQAIKMLEALNMGECQVENWSDDEDDEYEILSLPEAWLNCWLLEGVVTEVQWGVSYSNEDEAIWPG